MQIKTNTAGFAVHDVQKQRDTARDPLFDAVNGGLGSTGIQIPAYRGVTAV